MADDPALPPSPPSRRRATYDLVETAEILGVSRASAYRRAQDGEIPAIRLGRRWLVPRAALENMLDPPAGDSDEACHEVGTASLWRRTAGFATARGIELDTSSADPFEAKVASALATLSDGELEDLWERARAWAHELDTPLARPALLLLLPIAAELKGH